MDKTMAIGTKVIEQPNSPRCAATRTEPLDGRVVRVSKDGRRIRVTMWGRGRQSDRIVSAWYDARDWRAA